MEKKREFAKRESFSDISSAQESVHLGVTVAVEVDEEQIPQVKAVPIEKAVEKKQVPFHRTKLFCMTALILWSSILILFVATTTIILLGGGDHASDISDNGDREKLAFIKRLRHLLEPKN